MKIPGGFFITLEGIEGCGKTTQSRLLADFLKGKGLDVTVTREPGGTTIGKRIRAILLDSESHNITGLTELLLYSADRVQHLCEVIEPALQARGVVVCDRFTDATTAYQGYARGLDMKVIDNLSEIATQGRRPDLTLVLDLPVKIGLKRARKRSNVAGQIRETESIEKSLELFSTSELSDEIRFEEESAQFHERVRQGYLEIARREPERVKVIDAAGSVEGIKAAIRAVVDEALASAGK